MYFNKIKKTSTDKLSIEKHALGLDSSLEDYSLRLKKQEQEIKRLRNLFMVEKTKCERYQKKLQYIEENQDMFAKLKKAYVSLKLSAESRDISKQMSKTKFCVPTESIADNPDCCESLCAVNKRKLNEIKNIMQTMKEMVDLNQQRLLKLPKNEQYRKLDACKKMNNLYDENKQLKQQLEQTTKEIDELKHTSGSDTKESITLRKLCVKLASNLVPKTPSNDSIDSTLSAKESKLINELTKKYEGKKTRGRNHKNLNADSIPSAHKTNYEKNTILKTKSKHESSIDSGFNPNYETNEGVKINTNYDSSTDSKINYESSINYASSTYCKSSIESEHEFKSKTDTICPTNFKQNNNDSNYKNSPNYEFNPSRITSTHDSNTNYENKSMTTFESSTNHERANLSHKLNYISNSNDTPNPNELNPNYGSNPTSPTNPDCESNFINPNHVSISIQTNSISPRISNCEPKHRNITNIIYDSNLANLTNSKNESNTNFDSNINYISNAKLDMDGKLKTNNNPVVNVDYNTNNNFNSITELESNTDFEPNLDLNLNNDFKSNMEFLPYIEESDEDILAIKLMENPQFKNCSAEYKSNSARDKFSDEIKNGIPLRKSQSFHSQDKMLTEEEKKIIKAITSRNDNSNEINETTHKSGFTTARSHSSAQNLDSLETFRSALELMLDDVNEMCQ